MCSHVQRIEAKVIVVAKSDDERNKKSMWNLWLWDALRAIWTKYLHSFYALKEAVLEICSSDQNKYENAIRL